MVSVDIIAQHIMDLYYQEYKSQEDFFELHHFEFMVSAAYYKLLQMEYERQYNKNLSEEGIGFITLSQDWLIKDRLELKKEKDGDRYYIELNTKPFSFLFDKQNSGIQNVIAATGKRCQDYIRTSLQERFMLCNVPITNKGYWYLEGEKTIFFEKLKCKPDEIDVYYISQLENGKGGVANGMQADIIQWVMSMFTQAKQGVVIDMTNDGNPNKVLQTEISNFLSKIKSKS